MSEIKSAANSKQTKITVTARKRTVKKVVKIKKEAPEGVAQFFRARMKGKKKFLLKKDAMAIMKTAFEETFPDISKFATMKLSNDNKSGKQTLMFTISEDIMKADVVLS